MVLTRREREVAELVALGLTNRGIAERLFLSERTVEGHIDHAFTKLGLSSRTQLAMWVGAEGRGNARPGAASFPAQLTSFVGRQKDLAALPVLLADHRLVSLIGAGGSGKTRLALELARASDVAAGKQVWLVDLSSVSDAALVPEVIAGAVGAGGHEPPMEALIGSLQSIRGLLVLDNCEHVARAVRELVERVTANCPAIAFVVTSREPIRVPGEMTWRVEPLAIPKGGESTGQAREVESVRLFTDRARLAAADFDIDDSNVAAVMEVCRRLDGLPLAIELAAARVAVLSPSQIAQRLDDRFALLVGPSRSPAGRHQTLKTTLEWSYRLLPPTERRLFGRLSVFAGTFNLDAIEAVAGVEPLERGQLIELLGLLVDKSLVAVTAQTGGVLRYRLLDSMRAFGHEVLSGEPDAAVIVARHAHLYASMAIEAGRRLGGSDAIDWITLVAEESDNLRAAIEWAVGHDTRLALEVCASLAGYWDLRGSLYEGRHWLRRSLEGGPGDRSAERGAALAAAGLLAYRQSDYSEATRRFEETRDVAVAIGDRSLQARALAGLGDVHIINRDADGALRCYQQSLELFRELGDRASVARGLSRLGNAYNNLGDHETEERLYLESLALFRQLNDRVGVGDQLFSVGMGRSIAGKWESARPFVIESLAVRKELRDSLGEAWSQLVLGYIEVATRNTGAARGPLRAALTACDATGDVRGVSIALDFVAGLSLQLGKPAMAVRLASAAEGLRVGLGIGQMPWFESMMRDWLREAHDRMSSDEVEQEQMLGGDLSRKASIELALEQLIDGDSSRTALTHRERQVVALVADGLTNREIAERLTISERTADSHVQHAMNKLRFRSRAQLAAWHVKHAAGAGSAS